jgi:choline dehydrogenase
VTAYRFLRPSKAIGLGLRYLLSRRGALGESYVATGGFFRSDPSLEISDIIVVMAPALVMRGGVGARLRDLFPHEHGFAVSVSLGRPRSRGKIRLRSADPAAPPLIFPDYLSDPADMRALVAAVRKMRAMIREGDIRRVIAAELAPGEVPDDDDAIEADIRAKAGTFYHPNGTCRMGEDPGAVLDPRLRVRGVRGLRVADNSIMPTALTACTHGPAIMIGERAAALIDPRQRAEAARP